MFLLGQSFDRKIIKDGNELSAKNGGSIVDEDAFIKEFMNKIDLIEIIVHEIDNYVNYRLGNKKVFHIDVIIEGDLSGNFINAFVGRF